MAQNKITYLKDYKQPDYWVRHVDLDFDIHDHETFVTAVLQVERNGNHARPLVLSGEEMELLSLECDGVLLDPSAYTVDAELLSLQPPADETFTLKTRVRIHPETNTALSGLYKSGPMIVSQCESQGFRRITYSIDRPDNMATYTARIEADKATMPVLLSNGNMIDAGDLPGGRAFTRWEDPFPKPSYLFAAVAGDLKPLDSEFITRSGCKVDLRIWAEPKDFDKLDHAMDCLKASMKWDEDRFDRESDLDIFQIVATPFFNFGAMENKSLNIFNTSAVLANHRTQTDANFNSVDRIVAHEYFHNWTGNRITCRDWFQLTLKEGLTVYRDQEYTADRTSRAVARIDQAQGLRANQFAEDGGPFAHPIRPDQFENIENFYTATVYDKGAEVIRMIEVLLGRDGFKAGMDLYFSRHDGQAVTCDDFVQCMAEASGRDFSQFMLWYTQAGTPRVEADWTYDAVAQTMTLNFCQTVPPTPNQPDKQPMLIPVRVGLVDASGDDVVLERNSGATEIVLELDAEQNSFTFDNIPPGCVPSLLRNFSAPIKLDAPYSDDDLRHLMMHDIDGFNQFEAGNRYLSKKMLEQIARAEMGQPVVVEPGVIDALRTVMRSPAPDKLLQARLIGLPSISALEQELPSINPLAVDAVYEAFRAEIGKNLYAELVGLYTTNDLNVPEGRAIRNRALSYLSAGANPIIGKVLCVQFDCSNTMTDIFAAFGLLATETHWAHGADAKARSKTFFDSYKDEALVVDKWFSIMAQAPHSDPVKALEDLRNHPDFIPTNPNRARALYGGVFENAPVFHAPDGSGYGFVADFIVDIDGKNPKLASRLVGGFADYKRYQSPWQDGMAAALQSIADRRGASVSRDLSERLKLLGFTPSAGGNAQALQAGMTP